MARPAVNAAGVSGAPGKFRDLMSTPRQGALCEKNFVSAWTGQNIPRFPHIPRFSSIGVPVPGNVGKAGNVSAAFRPVEANLGRGVVGVGARTP
jgi:hypothetical protein